MPNRIITTNVPEFKMTDNGINTSKYNIINFIPLNLIVQFSKLPNVYFLIIGIMQMILHHKLRRIPRYLHSPHHGRRCLRHQGSFLGFEKETI